MTRKELDNLDHYTISKLSLDDTKDEQVLARIEEMAEDSQYEAEAGAAREFYEALDELIHKHAAQINGTREYARLFAVAQKMLWQGISAMDKKVRQRMLAENVIFSMRNKIDILGNLDAYLYIFEFGVGPDVQERQAFLYALTHNAERLGNEQISLKSGEAVPPQVANWIKDYLSYTDPKNPKGQSYELTQYFYSSPNVKKLNPDEKQILNQIISIYNDLRYPKYVPVIENPDAEKPKATPPAPKPVQTISRPTPPVPTPVPVAAQPKPAAPEAKAPTTAFDKKLSEISAPSAHGANIEQLIKRVEAQKPSPPPVRMPAPIKKAEGVRMTPDEIKREVSTPELPMHEEPKEIEPNDARQEEAYQQPVTETRSPAEKQNYDLRTMDDLKRVPISYLRSGDLRNQISNLKSRIIAIAAANHMLNYYGVTAFEQSPLFKAYLEHGKAKFGGAEAGQLTQAEFEAVADLRKEIEKL